MKEYGKVGRDVGFFGRWTRLMMGIALTLLMLYDLIGGDHTHDTRSYILMVVFFTGIVLAYYAGYVYLGEKIKDKSPWIATIIFVFLFNAFVVPYELSLGYLIGMPYINHPILIAIFAYIGVSFVFQFISKYGGCEVIAVQNFFLKKNYSSYCVPLLPIDILEKTIVNAIVKSKAKKINTP